MELKDKALRLAARAVARAMATSKDPYAIAQAALGGALDEVLSAALGGEAHQIYKLRNVDHLRIVYDLSPLMELAGGGWADLLSDMRIDKITGRHHKEVRSVENLAPPILPAEKGKPEDPPVEPPGQSG